MIGKQRRSVALRYTVLTRWLAITGLLALLVVLGWATPAVDWMLLVGGLAVVGVVLAILRWFEFGVLALLLTTAFVRFTLPTGTHSRIVVSLLVACLLLVIWITGMLLRRRFYLAPSRSNLPLIGFMLAASLSVLWHLVFMDPVVEAHFGSSLTFSYARILIGGLAVMLLLPALLFLVADVVRDEKWIRRIIGGLLAIGTLQLVSHLTGIKFGEGDFGLKTAGMFHMWMVALAWSQLVFNRDLRQWQKAFLALLTAGWLYWGFVVRIEWISGWLPPFIALLAISFMRSRKLFLISLAIIVAVFLFRTDYYYQKVWLESRRWDFNRFWLWKTIVFDLTLAKAQPLLGMGPAGYARYFMTYYPGRAMSAHNNYVDIIAQTGIIGTGFFMWFLWSVIRTGLDVRERAGHDFIGALGRGLLGGFLGICASMMLNDWFVPFVYNTSIAGFDHTLYSWVLLGILGSIRRIYAEKEAI